MMVTISKYCFEKLMHKMLEMENQLQKHNTLWTTKPSLIFLLLFFFLLPWDPMLVIDVEFYPFSKCKEVSPFEIIHSV